MSCHVGPSFTDEQFHNTGVPCSQDWPRRLSRRLVVRANGFSLHAAVVVPAGQRRRLEPMCRYALRPPVAALMRRAFAFDVLGRWRRQCAAVQQGSGSESGDDVVTADSP